MQEGGWELVTVYKTWGETYDLLKEEISKDKEGYVIRFNNGFRMKIKGEEYVRLHRILTNISNRDIWEYLKDNKPLDDLLEKVPDEFNDWVKSEVANFKEMYMITLTMAELTFIKFIKPEMSRKEAAEIIKTKDKGIQPILFKKLDNKDYSDLIWKKLYPSYSKPFKKNNEES
jgi:RNA ligase